MRYRKLSATGDYIFGHSQKDFYQDEPNAVAQAVQTRLGLWLGEWYLDTEEGTPYMQGILGKYSQDVADATIQDRVSKTLSVVDIKNYVSTKDPLSRNLSVQFEIDTDYGPTAVEIQNYGSY